MCKRASFLYLKCLTNKEIVLFKSHLQALNLRWSLSRPFPLCKLLPLNEKELVKRLKTGDQLAFTQIVDLYQEQVVNTCMGMVHNLQDAEDLSQDVFIEVFKSIHQFNGESKFSTWLYRIAISKSLNLIRSRKRQKRAAFFKSLVGLEKLENLSMGNNSFNHPGVNIENQEKAKLLFAKINELPEKQRVVFTLCKLEELSYKEVAEITELSVSSIESLMHRAKKNLRKKLEHYYKNEII